MVTSENLGIGASWSRKSVLATHQNKPPAEPRLRRRVSSGCCHGNDIHIVTWFDMNVCSRFLKSSNKEDSENIQDQVNSDMDAAYVLFKRWKLGWVQCSHISFSWSSSKAAYNPLQQNIFPHKTVNCFNQQAQGRWGFYHTSVRKLFTCWQLREKCSSIWLPVLNKKMSSITGMKKDLLP